MNFPPARFLSRREAPIGKGAPCRSAVLRRTAFASLVLAASAAAAQTPVRPPDAGLLQHDKAPPRPPERPDELARPADGRMGAAGVSGVEGRTLPIARVVVEGCTVIPQEAWDQRFQQEEVQWLTLPQLRNLAAQVQAAVQAAGRPFAVAYLPPQDLSTQELHVRVVEGRYGEVRATGPLAEAAAPWLSPLKPGQAIGIELERQALLLSELPGVAAVATVSPGANPGDADVSVEVEPGRSWGGDLRIDNYGNRYAGRYRVVGSLYFDRLLLLGDRLSLAAGTSDQGGGQGSVSYGLPLGTQGVRLTVSGAVSHYELGKEFDILGASGKVTSGMATVSVPLQVTSRARAEWQSGLQAQAISNKQALFETEDQRSNLAWTNTLQASRWFAGGGAAWGRVSAEMGRVRLKDDYSQQVDALTAHTAGGYLLMSLDAAVLKPVGEWAFYGHVAGQMADRNLDPSKKFVLGGASGVRAWPTSEGAGDDGALAQLEWRRQVGIAHPFVFMDAGRVRFNHQPWVNGRNTRSLAGAGLGLRMAQGPWELQGTVGWRVGAGHRASESDPTANRTQLWFSLGYQL